MEDEIKRAYSRAPGLQEVSMNHLKWPVPRGPAEPQPARAARSTARGKETAVAPAPVMQAAATRVVKMPWKSMVGVRSVACGRKLDSIEEDGEYGGI